MTREFDMKKMLVRVVILSFVIITCYSYSIEPSQQLANLLQEVETFSADFEQTLISPQGSAIQQTKGQLKAKKPGLFRWHTSPPLEQVLVTDGEHVWLYDPDLEQVTIQVLSNQFSRTPALLLSGEVDDIEQQYQVSILPSESSENLFRLTPKNPDSLFDSLFLAFNEQSQLATMVLKDSLGQETSLVFFNQQINEEFSENEFQFEMPDGVDVIRQ